jgi:hypothetical protein
MLKLILVCIAVAVSNVALSNDTSVEVLSRASLRAEIAVHLSNEERELAYEKYKKLAFTGDVDSLVAIADLSNDKTFVHYSEQTAFYYYIDAVKKDAIHAYSPLISILIDRDSQFYDLAKAGLFASNYLAKSGQGAESLLSYILWLSKSDKHEQINALAVKGFEKKQRYSVLVLGHIYEKGIGVSVDYRKSLNYFLKAKILGFDVENDLVRVEIKQYSPQVGGVVLHGAKRLNVNEIIEKQEGILQSIEEETIDIFTFPVNNNSLISATLMYSINQELGGLKYVFNDDKGRYESLKTSFIGQYGPFNGETTSFVWNKPFIQISLLKKTHCIKYCNSEEQESKSFVEVAYLFKNVILAKSIKEQESATSFKF